MSEWRVQREEKRRVKKKRDPGRLMTPKGSADLIPPQGGRSEGVYLKYGPKIGFGAKNAIYNLFKNRAHRIN